MRTTYHKEADMFAHLGKAGHTFVVTVNCEGVAGRGLALAARLACPEMFAHYRKDCREKRVSPGAPYRILDGQFILFPSKKHWRYPSRYEWIESGLIRIRDYADTLTGRVLHTPLPGCGLGRLEAVPVHEMLKNILGDTDLNLHIYLSAEQWATIEPEKTENRR